MAKAKGAMTGSDILDTPMQSFFNGKSVFITGASGFLGKVVLEKIVRSCHGVKKVYCLIRAKDGEAPQQRLQKVFEAPVSTVQLLDAASEYKPRQWSHQAVSMKDSQSATSSIVLPGGVCHNE